MKILKWFLISVAGLFIALGILIYSTTFHPDEVQDESFITEQSAPILKPGQKIKVLSWNIQYMAGKNYVFFYDLPNGDGPDERPSAVDTGVTFNEVKSVIEKENPDIILIQEIDEGSKRTDYTNQVKMLMDILPKEYSSYSSTFYHKAKYVPHPRIKAVSGSSSRQFLNIKSIKRSATSFRSFPTISL